jgi:hypothetical protein
MPEAFSGILNPHKPRFQEQAMSNDPRCCGTGTCIINAEGLCWCGQRWDGEKMCFMREPVSAPSQSSASSDTSANPHALQRPPAKEQD